MVIEQQNLQIITLKKQHLKRNITILSKFHSHEIFAGQIKEISMVPMKKKILPYKTQLKIQNHMIDLVSHRHFVRATIILNRPKGWTTSSFWTSSESSKELRAIIRLLTPIDDSFRVLPIRIVLSNVDNLDEFFSFSQNLIRTHYTPAAKFLQQVVHMMHHEREMRKIPHEIIDNYFSTDNSRLNLTILFKLLQIEYLSPKKAPINWRVGTYVYTYSF